MLSLKSLQNRLDHAYSNAQSEMDDAEMTASDSGEFEDMLAFNDASRKTQMANTILNESLRAKHGITKSIIDGIQ
ncbi:MULTISPECIES: type III secretion protein [Pseudomonas]|uniref:Type III secretion protein n=1 Tax=Pseudomonas quercus TaxID=2722792 RepID=A0ABX0YMV8_9PSED|nr:MULTISPECIES: type III secretion protein [Pseudomonas]MBF7143254.1 type III secretion protein [Pseudomonas sp. LY10J]NJP03431.1 type III secretion protein [Pseudomonas quercus]